MNECDDEIEKGNIYYRDWARQGGDAHCVQYNHVDAAKFKVP